jgi:hypothetical protein
MDKNREGKFLTTKAHQGAEVEEGKKKRRLMYPRTVGSSAPFAPSWLNFLREGGGHLFSITPA